MYKSSERALGFAALFLCVSNVLSSLLWLNISAKKTHSVMYLSPFFIIIIFLAILSILGKSDFHKDCFARRHLAKSHSFLKWPIFRSAPVQVSGRCDTDFTVDRILSSLWHLPSSKTMLDHSLLIQVDFLQRNKISLDHDSALIFYLCLIKNSESSLPCQNILYLWFIFPWPDEEKCDCWLLSIFTFS